MSGHSRFFVSRSLFTVFAIMALIWFCSCGGGFRSSGSSSGSGSGGSGNGNSGSGSSGSGTSGSGNSGSGSGGSSSGSGAASSTYIFVKNSQPVATMQVLRLNSDGSINAVSGSPFPVASSTLAIAGSYLIAGGNTIAAYTIDSATGTPTKTSSDVRGGWVAGNDRFVYAGATNAIYGYSLNNGMLQALPGSPFQVQSPPICDCATPTFSSLFVTQGYLFYAVDGGHAASSAHAGKIGSDGSFSPVTFGTISSGPELAVSPDGKFVYEFASALNGGELFDFDLANGTAMDGGSIVAENAGPIDPSSSFMFSRINDASGEAIGSYRIDPQTGKLTLTSTLENYGGTPEAVSPDGKYLLTLNLPTQTTYEIGVFSINSQTGALTKVGSYPLGSFSSSYSANGLVVGKF